MCECSHKKNINRALFQAQQSFKTIEAEAINPVFKNKYAKLPHILSSIKPTLWQHDLMIRHYQDVHPVNQALIETTVVTHIPTGEQVQDVRFVISEKPGSQGLGSAETYLRRYAISAILGIAVGEEIDDDGYVENEYIEQRKRMAHVVNSALKVLPEAQREVTLTQIKQHFKLDIDNLDHEQMVQAMYFIVIALKPKE